MKCVQALTGGYKFWGWCDKIYTTNVGTNKIPVPFSVATGGCLGWGGKVYRLALWLVRVQQPVSEKVR